MCVGAQRPDVLEAGACVHRCPEARLSLEAGLTYAGAGACARREGRARGPDVLEAGACVHRCPEARLSLEAGLT